MQEKIIKIHKNPLPWKSWRTTNQILFFTIFLVIITLSIAIVISQFLLDYSSTYLRELSYQVSEKQTKKQVFLNSYNQLRYTKAYIQSGIQTLSAINDIYQYVQSYNMTVEPPTECLTPMNNNLAQIPQFCFARFVPELSKQNQEMYLEKLTSIMNQYSPQFDITQLTYYGSKNKDQFGAAYNYTMPTIYRPHDRPWYQEHLKAISTLKGTNQTYRMSDPYISYNTKSIMITETMSLLKKNGEFDGVVAQNSKFPQIPQEDDSYGQPLIVDEEGKLLTTVVNGKRADSLNSIFTTNFTGFTEEDWSNLKSISSPNIFRISILFNQIKNANVQISATKFNSYYLFLFIDDSYFRNISNKIIIQIDQFYSTLYFEVILIGLGALAMNIFLQIISIKFLFLRDLMKLSFIAERQILKHSILFTQLKVQKTTSDIRQLFISYYKALNRLTSSQASSKNFKCQLIEKKQYPLRNKQKESKKYLTRIKKLLMLIKDTNIPNLIIQNKLKDKILQMVSSCVNECYQNSEQFF